jgi:hypothetical protein
MHLQWFDVLGQDMGPHVQSPLHLILVAAVYHLCIMPIKISGNRMIFIIPFFMIPTIG